MTSVDLSFVQLLRWVFPPDLLDAFRVTRVRTIANAKTGEETLEITVEEQNAPPIIPEEHRGKRVVSKGFRRPISVQDFPLRDRYCLLVVRCRRWEIEEAGTLERHRTRLANHVVDRSCTFVGSPDPKRVCHVQSRWNAASQP